MRKIRKFVPGIDGTPSLERRELMTGPATLQTAMVPLDRTPAGWTYGGQPGGLYGVDSTGTPQNRPPEAVLAEALRDSSSIQPRDKYGNPNPKGIIGVVVIGPSVAHMWAPAFASIAKASGILNPRVRIVNLAQSGRVASDWTYQGPVWNNALAMLRKAGVSPAQVQVVINENVSLGAQGGSLQNRIAVGASELRAAVDVASRVFPNLALFFDKPFHNASAASPARSVTEPYGFEDGFIARDVALNQRLGAGPTVLVGPSYDWGDVPGNRYFFYDGVHPTGAGSAAVAQRVWRGLVSSPGAQRWLLRG